MSKVILINGSPNEFGCTYTGLKEIADVLNGRNIDTEMIWIGSDPVAGCTGCYACWCVNQGVTFFYPEPLSMQGSGSVHLNQLAYGDGQGVYHSHVQTIP